MSFIGNAPAAIPTSFQTVQADSFNGTGSAVNFTLSRQITNLYDIEVLVDNVQQSPYDGSYSVAGTTLTFSAAPSSGTNNIYVIYRDHPITSIAPRAQTIEVVSPGGGTSSLVAASSASDYTLTLPDEAGTIITSGSATVLPKGVPTFSAYLASSGGSIANATFTKLIFDTEYWDTNSYFASSRFTPLVAGYYQINAAYQWASASAGFITIMRNGSEYKRGEWSSSAQQDHSCSGIVYCNGSSDYIEIYAYQTSGGNVTPQGGSTISWFDGVLVRAD